MKSAFIEIWNVTFESSIGVLFFTLQSQLNRHLSYIRWPG